MEISVARFCGQPPPPPPPPSPSNRCYCDFLVLLYGGGFAVISVGDMPGAPSFSPCSGEISRVIPAFFSKLFFSFFLRLLISSEGCSRIITGEYMSHLLNLFSVAI